MSSTKPRKERKRNPAIERIETLVYKEAFERVLTRFLDLYRIRFPSLTYWHTKLNLNIKLLDLVYVSWKKHEASLLERKYKFMTEEDNYFCRFLQITFIWDELDETEKDWIWRTFSGLYLLVKTIRVLPQVAVIQLVNGYEMCEGSASSKTSTDRIPTVDDLHRCLKTAISSIKESHMDAIGDIGLWIMRKDNIVHLFFPPRMESIAALIVRQLLSGKNVMSKLKSCSSDLQGVVKSINPDCKVSGVSKWDKNMGAEAVVKYMEEIVDGIFAGMLEKDIRLDAEFGERMKKNLKGQLLPLLNKIIPQVLMGGETETEDLKKSEPKKIRTIFDDDQDDVPVEKELLSYSSLEKHVKRKIESLSGISRLPDKPLSKTEGEKLGK